MESVKKKGDPLSGIVLAIAAAALLFVFIAVASLQSPDAHERYLEREQIDRVCQLQHDELQELAVRRALRDRCEEAKEAYRQRWGSDP